MTAPLTAFLSGEPLGEFSFGNGQATFDYSEDTAQDSTPLSLSMPRSRQHHGNRPVSAFLKGLLPDNQAALANMARGAGTSPNSLQGLLGAYGRDVAGALQILPTGEPSDDSTPGNLDTSPLLDHDSFERLVATTRQAYSSPVPAQNAFRFSVAGAQPKLALSMNSAGQWIQPTRDIATTHLIKPLTHDVTGGVAEMEILEQITMRSARSLGLDAPQIQLWTSERTGQQALIVPRYDRKIVGNHVVRIHQEDLCQALAIPPEKKYQHRDSGPGVGAIARLFADRAPRQRHELGVAFFRLLVFNLGILGTDAHAKNYSLFLDGRDVAMTPLYDSISAAAHATQVQNTGDLTFPMSIGGEYKFDSISPQGLLREGKRLGLDTTAAENIMNDLLPRIPAAMTTAAEELHRADLAQMLSDGLSRLSLSRHFTGHV